MQKQKTDTDKQYLKISLRFLESNVNTVQTFMAIKSISGSIFTGTLKKRPHVEGVGNSFLS